MSDQDNRRVCETCKWWGDRGIAKGVCRANPPLAKGQLSGSDFRVRADECARAIWPVTDPQDWCGQWTPARGYCEHEWTAAKVLYESGMEVLHCVCVRCGAKHTGDNPPEVGERGEP